MFAFVRRLFARPRVDPLVGLEAERTRLVIGLGNPGPEYADTRHNVGFRCVDELARRFDARWQPRTDELHSLIAQAEIDEGLTLVVAKPQTFMNRSGTAARAVLDKLGLKRQHCLVVYDDMDLPFGALRLRERGSPGTHNGMRSVVSTLHDDNVPRLRIGISQAGPGAATNHVLSEFDANEREAVDELVQRAADAALAWAIDGAPAAMNRYNSVRAS